MYFIQLCRYIFSSDKCIVVEHSRYLLFVLLMLHVSILLTDSRQTNKIHTQNTSIWEAENYLFASSEILKSYFNFRVAFSCDCIFHKLKDFYKTVRVSENNYSFLLLKYSTFLFAMFGLTDCSWNIACLIGCLCCCSNIMTLSTFLCLWPFYVFLQLHLFSYFSHRTW